MASNENSGQVSPKNESLPKADNSGPENDSQPSQRSKKQSSDQPSVREPSQPENESEKSLSKSPSQSNKESLAKLAKKDSTGLLGSVEEKFDSLYNENEDEAFQPPAPDA